MTLIYFTVANTRANTVENRRHWAIAEKNRSDEYTYCLTATIQGSANKAGLQLNQKYVIWNVVSAP